MIYQLYSEAGLSDFMSPTNEMRQKQRVAWNRRRNVLLKSTNFNQDRKRNLWRKIIWCYNVLITMRGFLEDMIYLNWFKSSNINSASQLHKHNRLVCAIKGKATERGICLLYSSSDHFLRGLEHSFALLLYDILCRKGKTDWEDTAGYILSPPNGSHWPLGNP